MKPSCLEVCVMCALSFMQTGLFAGRKLPIQERIFLRISSSQLAGNLISLIVGLL